MKISVKRVYDAVKDTDGTRVLVDRLWPRGVSKEEAKIEVWAKDLAPSSKLRQWFHEDKIKNFKPFIEKYEQELLSNRQLVDKYFPKQGNITVVTAVKDIERSHIPTLTVFLKNQ